MTAVLLSILSSLLFSMGLPNEFWHFGAPLLSLFSLTPLIIALEKTRTLKHSVLVGSIFAVISTALTNFWLLFFQEFAIWTLGGAVLGYVVYHAIFIPVLWYVWKSTASGIARVVFIAATWTGYEYLKSVGYLGYPWGLSGYPLNTQLVLIQVVDLVGIWGLCFLVVSTNAILAEIVLHWHTVRVLLRPVLFVAVLWMATTTYGIIRLTEVFAVRTSIDMVLVQPNVDSWQPGNFESALATYQDLTTQALNERPADLVVWGETTLRYPFPQPIYATIPTQQPFLDFLAAADSPLLSGTPLQAQRDPASYENGVVLIQRDGTVSFEYGKTQLVPFAESVPFWEVETVRSFLQQAVGLQSAGWQPGMTYDVFNLSTRSGNQVIIGVPICFEDSFPDVVSKLVAAGAEVLVNVTNNSWSQTKSAQVQHLVAARFRAVEHRMSLARSTNSGVSALIDAHGRITDALPMFEQGYLRLGVPVYEPTTTVYAIIGDALPVLCFGLLLLLLVQLRFKTAKEAQI